MNRIAILSLVVLTPVSSGCSICLYDSVEGSGVSQSEIREIGEFDKVSFSGSGAVVIQCGQTQCGQTQRGQAQRVQTPTLKVTSDDNLLELIETVVEDGTLKIRFAQSVRTKIGPEFEIGIGTIEEVSIAGSGDVKIRQLDTDKLDLSITGSGDCLASGNTSHVSLAIAGSGEADLRKLQANSAKVRITGSGCAIINAKENLSAKISGSGNIRYLKNPKIQKAVTGSGSITAIEDLPEELAGGSKSQDLGPTLETESEDEEESD